MGRSTLRFAREESLRLVKADGAALGKVVPEHSSRTAPAAVGGGGSSPISDATSGLRVFRRQAEWYRRVFVLNLCLLKNRDEGFFTFLPLWTDTRRTSEEFGGAYDQERIGDSG